MCRLLPLSVALLGACAATRAPELRGDPSAPAWRFLCSRYDADGDGRVVPSEYTRSARGFANLDANGDGRIDPLDFDPSFDGVPRGPWKSLEEFEYGEGGPEAGDVAPPFSLSSTTGATFELASFRGQKPVALVFGSFT